MRWIIVSLTIVFSTITATAYSQQISFSGVKVPLERVLEEVKKQTGYVSFFKESSLEKAGTVSISAVKKPLKDFLDEVFRQVGLRYKIQNKAIVMMEGERNVNEDAGATPIKISGVITDGNGMPLVGATVRVKGTKKFIISDKKGYFEINVGSGDVLTVSYIGFESREILITSENLNSSLLTITLSKFTSQLEEVIINKGYYTESRLTTTGAVGKITAEQIGKQPVLNVLAAMQAQVPGLIVTQQTGVPGGGFKVSIRGTNSLRNAIAVEEGLNGNDPLYIIDGIPYFSTPQTMLQIASVSGTIYPFGTGANPLNCINPNDVLSIEILKDADATAIYGSRGSNGIILITTKKGKMGDMRIEGNVYAGVGKVIRKMNLLNTEQYLEMRKEGFKNDGITTYPANAYDLNGTWDAQRYTNWQKELIGGTASSTNAQLTVSGGATNIQYRFGGGYYKETTVFPGSSSEQRYSVSFNLNSTSLNQKFKSSISANYAYGLSNLLSQDLTKRSLILSPNAPALYNDKGELNFQHSTWQNPLAYTRQPYNVRTHALISNAFLNYEVIKGLDFKINFGYTNTLNKQVLKIPIRSLDPGLSSGAKINSATFQNGTISSWNIEPQIIYFKSFNQRHKINMLVGTTFYSETAEALNQSASGFLNESLMDNVSAVSSANVLNTFTNSIYKYNAVFGRFNYDYKRKYLFNITGRRDGSSRFGPGRQFANFGAIGAAWIFTEETFLRNLQSLNFGKLRGSYGTAGNDRIPNYGFVDAYTTTNAGQYQNNVGLRPSQLINPDYSWEITKKLELALELGFWQDKLRLTTAYYRNISSNQLVGYPLPSNTGFTTVQYNLPATVQNTGWEFELTTINIKSSRFKWSSSFNISIPRNKLVSYPNLEGSSYASVYVVGEPLAIRRVYQYMGVDIQTGLYHVKDVDNNGMYNAADQVVNKFIGQRLNGGLSNSLSFKGFQLDVLFQFVQQQGPNYIFDFGMPGEMSNFPTEIMNRWRNVGDIKQIQRFSASNAILSWVNYLLSDAAITDASYIRLKNISLSYNLPITLLKQIKFQSAQVYLRGQNMLTVTSYKGLDPETQGATLPPLRLLVAGVQISF